MAACTDTWPMQPLPLSTPRSFFLHSHSFHSLHGVTGTTTLFSMCLPNDPECGNFASILRLLLIGAILMQPCYVALCASNLRALRIRVFKFSPFQRMRQRICQICAKNICKQKKQKNSEPGLEPGISNRKSATLTTRLPCLP